MERTILLTNDGSSTVQLAGSGESYHSRHGAIQESRHVFIDAGLDEFVKNNPSIQTITIFETGFGTGLNALLTCQYAQAHSLDILYETVELYPLTAEETIALNYPTILGDEELFKGIHLAPWGIPVEVTGGFQLTKHHESVTGYNSHNKYHIIYHDAFAPESQPELWTEAMFSRLYNMTEQGGILLTYCSKVVVRRAMQAAGFEVEKTPGPWGKREMLRAKKP